MTEKTKKQKTSSISEEDMSILLQRYTATTVLALLQEVAQSPGAKLNWEALVKNTATGISNAREYQMLWRHLAYRDALVDKWEDGAQPMDDNSDLECELEPSPSVSGETLAEAAACVKVLIGSGLPNESSLHSSSTIEAPLTISIPNGLSNRAYSENSQSAGITRGMNITIPVSVPVSVQKPVIPSELLDGNGLAGGPARRKRKPWSEAEDKELIAAVQKFGVGNWANMLRGEFKGDRTAQQLSQRWTIIKKRLGNSSLELNSSGPHLSEAQLATRSALSLALDMPDINLTATCINNPALKTQPSNSAGANDALVQTQNQSHQSTATAKSSPTGSLSSSVKPGSTSNSKKPSPKFYPSSGSILDATAVAAGARIGSPEDAASLLKAAKHAVHVKTAGGSSIKPAVPSGGATQLEVHANVHYVRTGVSSETLSKSSVVTSSTSRTCPIKSASPTVEHNPLNSASSLNTSSEECNAGSCSQAMEHQPKQERKPSEEGKGSTFGSGPNEQVRENEACIPGNQPGGGIKEHGAECPKPEAELKSSDTFAEKSSEKLVVASDQVDTSGKQVEEKRNANGGNAVCLPENKTTSESIAVENYDKQGTK